MATKKKEIHPFFKDGWDSDFAYYLMATIVVVPTAIGSVLLIIETVKLY